MSLRDLRLEGELLEREATGFARAPEELTEPNAAAGLRIDRIAAYFAGVFSKHRSHRLAGLALYTPAQPGAREPKKWSASQYCSFYHTRGGSIRSNCRARISVTQKLLCT